MLASFLDERMLRFNVVFRTRQAQLKKVVELGDVGKCLYIKDCLVKVVM